MEESKQINQVIDVLMLAGTLLIESGSEIHRVEDTMIRIAHSQGIVDCNVLAMPVAIFFSIENANVTRMKRILRTNYNIEKVCDVNQISRQLVSGEIDLEQAYQSLSGHCNCICLCFFTCRREICSHSFCHCFCGSLCLWFFSPYLDAL